MVTRYKTAAPIQIISEVVTGLPTDRPIAVYYRQSTDAQIGNISTTIQTVDMVEYLKRRGWAEDKIIMIDMDGGISGSTKIDERPGMSTLFSLISESKIGAVACQDEDRLFRDVTQIQVNIFIEACRMSNVLVITPTMVYDFANAMSGSFHARQFRFKSEMAAEYINAVIKGKLHVAKRYLLNEGRWAGSGIPPGFMVDMRKTLPDGSKNPDWRHYVPFEPYAQVVNQYFQIFLAHAGNIRATVREIHEHGPYYPDPSNCQPPDGFKVFYRLRHYGKGYCPGRTGLTNTLTNAAYIGHWAVNDAIVRWNNHPVIVPIDIFMRAFNYISQVTLDGKPNKTFKAMPENGRPSKDMLRPIERPLLAGMIVSKDDGRWQNVGTYWVNKLQHYTYVLWGAHPRDKYIWGKKAEEIDSRVTLFLLKKLSATFDQEVWGATLASLQTDFEKVYHLKVAQLDNLKTVMGNLIAGLEILTNRDMIKAAQARYEDAQTEYGRLSKELAELSSEAGLMEEIKTLKESYSPALENWPNMTRDEKRVVLRAFIQQIEATATNDNSLQLIIRWKDDSFDEMVLPRVATGGTPWLSSQANRLLELVNLHAPQVEIAREFSDRKWKDIRSKAWSLKGSGCLKVEPKPIKDRESYWDYLDRINDDSLDNINSVTCSGTARRDGPG